MQHFFYPPLIKLKLWIKNNTEVSLKISSNIVGDSNDENSSPHRLSLTNTHVPNLRKAFANGSSASIKLSKIQFHKIGKSRFFLGCLLGSLIKTGLSITESLLKPLAESVLIPLVLTVAASVTDAGIRQKMFGSGTTTLIIPYKKINDIIQIIIWFINESF